MQPDQVTLSQCTVVKPLKFLIQAYVNGDGLYANGNWLDLVHQKNTSADMAPTAGQMPRALGLAFASKCFREAQQKNQSKHLQLSNQGNEICFCTIGDASTSEGHFWESINAAAVLEVPLAVFVWDDGYGISVPKNLQTTKSSISDALAGMQKLADTNGIEIYKVKAWDYAGMCEVFEEGLQKIRDTHTPALFHIEEVTQPQGHSTSGSHERYKSAERLEWEKNWDCIKKMREWMLESGLATITELNGVEVEAKEFVKEAKANAWDKFIGPIKLQAENTVQISNGLQLVNPAVQQIIAELSSNKEPLRRDILKALAKISDAAVGVKGVEKVKEYAAQLKNEAAGLFNTYLYNEGPKSALRVAAVQATYPDWFVGIRQNGVILGLEFAHPQGAKYVMRHLYENGVWAIFSTLDPRVLQYKPGILLKPEVAEEMLDRTELAIGKAYAEVRNERRSA
jgi:TPP-dependent pyruvate/acetoin dehydrogenase alpha subunit